MLAHEGIDQNLRFLILEVRKQLEQTRDYIPNRSPSLVKTIRARDDYIDNLKSIVQRKCFSLAAETGPDGSPSVDMLKAIDVISANLERISDFCENVIKQLGYIENEEILGEYDFSPFFDELVTNVGHIDQAVFGQDVQLALRICRAEHTLDQMYGEAFGSILQRLQSGRDTQTLVTILFISHYLERMGDALQNVGEAVISACLGERIKIDQFAALEDSLEASDLEASGLQGEITLKAMGETRSGCRIDRVSEKTGDGSRSVIFKEGRIGKLAEEKASIDRWQELVPGLAPRIYSFQQHGDSGSILFEYLAGHTFDEILLRGEMHDLDAATTRLCRILGEVWHRTRKDEPSRACFVEQLRKRLGDIYAVHPGFRDHSGGIGGIRVESFEDLLGRVATVEEELAAPISVFIHGDLNVDNIIYDETQDRVHFIDLHRSRMMDYVQDVSVFLVSNYRLPAYDADVRRRIEHVTLRVYDFAHGFARDCGDVTFTTRLALGLARSFATSTRFVLDEHFAKSMFLRSRYLLERVLERHADGRDEFEVPREVLFA